MRVELRTVRDEDLDVLFRMMKDPESVRMAAFTADDPSDRGRFDTHMARVRADPENIFRVVHAHGRAGNEKAPRRWFSR